MGVLEQAAVRQAQGQTFALATVSGLLAMLAVGAVDPGRLAWPGYLAAANGLTAALILARRLAQRADVTTRTASTARSTSSTLL